MEKIQKYHYFLNIYHAIGKFSSRQINDIFLNFPRKQELTLYANWDNLHDGSDPIFFSGKIRKVFQNVVC